MSRLVTVRCDAAGCSAECTAGFVIDALRATRSSTKSIEVVESVIAKLQGEGE